MPLPKLIVSIVCLLLLFWGCSNPKNKKEDALKQPLKTQLKKTSGIKDADLSKWVEELNNYLLSYDTLSPFKTYLLETVHLPKAYKDSLKSDNDLRLNSEVDGVSLIPYAQTYISNLLTQILNHPHISNYDLKELLNFDIACSNDGRLYNIKLDENTGGSYRSQLSWMQYRDPNGKVVNYYPQQYSDNGIDSDNQESTLNQDGYEQIWSISTKQGTKYLLAGSVRGCNTCMGNYIQLLSYKDGRLKTDFSYSVSTRWGMEDGEGNNNVINYDDKKKRIEIHYLTNDMAPACRCAVGKNRDDVSDTNEGEENYGKDCWCTFTFNGYTFVQGK